MAEIKRCENCGVTLCRDNAAMRKHGRVKKIGNLCKQCKNDRDKESFNKNKKKLLAAKKSRRDDALDHIGKCSFCSEAIGISTVIENKFNKKRLNCCAKCDNRKNSSHNIYSTIGRGNSHPNFIVQFKSLKEQADFELLRNLQIDFSGTAFGSRVSKVGQNSYEILRHEDEEGKVTYTTETRICNAKIRRPDGSLRDCGGELRHDEREVLYCEKCFLCY